MWEKVLKRNSSKSEAFPTLKGWRQPQLCLCDIEYELRLENWEYHNCKIWGGDAFNPERFSEGFSKANTSSSISIWLGDSKCIALSFAMLEANIAPTMIPSYSFELSPSNLLRLWCPTLKINWLCGWKVTGAQGIVFNMLTDCVSFWHFRFE